MRTALMRVGLVVALAGCSSGTQSDPRPPAPAASSRVETGGGETVTLPTGAEPITVRASIGASVADVWKVLPSAYADLGIPIEMLNPSDYRIGNQSFRVRRRIGQLPMVRLLSCGGPPGAPNAETFDITMYMVSQISPGQAGSTTLATVVQAVGRSPNFAGNDVSCASTGTLERRVEELVRAKIGK